MKPSGKLRYMSAYRFFRRDCVPKIKQENPELDGKQRQRVIKTMWRGLDDNQKYAYVQMSRLDQEKATYVYRLKKIKENLIRSYPELDSLLEDSEKQELMKKID